MLLSCVFENLAVEHSCPNHLFIGLIFLLLLLAKIHQSIRLASMSFRDGIIKDLKCVFIGGVPTQMDSDNGTVKAHMPSNMGLVTELMFPFAVMV